MALAEHLATELQRLRQERFRLAEAALAPVQSGQVVEAAQRFGAALTTLSIE